MLASRPTGKTKTLYSEKALGERLKELSCLHSLRRLIARANSVDEILRGIVDLLPSSWQHPDVTAARIEFDGQTYQTPDFRQTPWRLGTSLLVGDRQAGVVDVVYLEPRPEEDIGPFLSHERDLLETVAIQAGLAICHLEQRQHVRQREEALHHRATLLKQVAEHTHRQQQTHSQIISNIDNVILPIVRRLEQSLSHTQQQQADLLRESLQDLASPCVEKLSRRFRSLTPTELRICDAIRRDLSSKEIAHIEAISVGTVSRHRENIRRKLNLTHKNVHLATFLRSICQD